MKDTVRYVIVVHGIGTQRKNETVISVVNRFAAARRGGVLNERIKYGFEANDLLTLGRASGQTGRSKSDESGQPWMEFRGIPSARPPEPLTEPFLSEYARDGDDIRFVDLWWSDIMESDYDAVGQEMGAWAQGLFGRLAARRRAPTWMSRTLQVFADFALVARFVTKFRFKKSADIVFNKFVGDVQLYGEYPQTRGQGVRRFHDLMRAIEDEHERLESARVRDEKLRHESDPKSPAPQEAREARFSIIAHSLGTVMSMDALLYAHAKPTVKALLHRPGGGYPLLGFVTRDEVAMARDLANQEPDASLLEARLKEAIPVLDSRWIDRVDTWVTLGSPIDKFLYIWWLNYSFLEDRSWRVEQDNVKPIAHYNYCDEQDPVGEHLDFACTAKQFKESFDTREDKVFNRYRVPGAAHNEYWNDQGLFDWIVARAVDCADEEVRGDNKNRLKPQGMEVAEPTWFDLKAYRWLLMFIYKLIPFLVVTLNFLSLSVVIAAESMLSIVIGTMVMVMVTIMGRRIIDLSIWWRLVQRDKYEQKWRERERLWAQIQADESRSDSTLARSDEELGRWRQERETRNRASARHTRDSLMILAFNYCLAGVLLSLTLQSYLTFDSVLDSVEGQQALQALGLKGLVISGLAGLSLLIYRQFVRLRPQYRLWESDSKLVVGPAVSVIFFVGVVAALAWYPANFCFGQVYLGEGFSGDDEDGLILATGFLHLAIFFVMSAVVLTYRQAKHWEVKRELAKDAKAPIELGFAKYINKAAS